MTPEFEAAIKERNAAFEADDVSWARKMLPMASSDRVVEMAFHKARHHCIQVSDGKRVESRDWLLSRGLSDIMGDPINPTQKLPQ